MEARVGIGPLIVEIVFKMRIFIGYVSERCACKNEHQSRTFADVFAE